jgi:hypothetical protein
MPTTLRMSEINPSIVSVAIVLFDVDANSKSPVTLRVKPDRRRNHVAFPEALERRLAPPSARRTEIAHGSFAGLALENHAASELDDNATLGHSSVFEEGPEMKPVKIATDP